MVMQSLWHARAATYGDYVRYELRWGTSGLAEFFAGMAWHCAEQALAAEEFEQATMQAMEEEAQKEKPN